MTAGVRRWCGALLAALFLLSSTPLTAAAAPLGEYAGYLSFSVESITPALVDAGTTVVTLSGTVTNNGPETLRSAVGRIQRGKPYDSPEALQADLADPAQPAFSWSPFEDLVAEIPAGGTAPFTVSAAAFGEVYQGLAIDAPGVYPIMVNINAQFDSGPLNGARVGELHALLTVVSVPPVAVEGPGTVLTPAGEAPATTTVRDPGADAVVTGTAQALNVLVPLVDRPHRDPTGAFYDDALVPLISRGGRLDEALRAAENSELPASAITLAVDPELLEELRLMSAGYTVGPYLFDITRGTSNGSVSTSAPVTTSTAETTGPSSTTASSTDSADVSSTTVTTAGTAGTDVTPTSPIYVPVPGPDAVQGTGAAAATSFLARLQRVATVVSVLVLPYTDIDVVAALRNGHRELLEPAFSTGRDLARSILGTRAQLVTNIAWPIDGLADGVSLAALRDQDITGAVLENVTVYGTGSPIATVNTTSGPITALLSSRTLPTGATALNTFTAVTAQNYFSNVTTSAVYAPSRDDNTSSSYPELTTLLAAMARARIVRGGTLASMTASTPASTGTVTYPVDAAPGELPAAAFVQVQDTVAAFATVQSAFTPLTDLAPGEQATTAPADLFATEIGGMSRQAAGGYREQPTAFAASMKSVADIVSTVQAGVTIVPRASKLILTSTSSPLLVSLQNTLPYTVHVRVRINPADAAQAGIQIQDVGIQTVPAGRPLQVPIPAEIRRSGPLVVGVQLTTPDGAIWGPEEPLQMQSTAYGAFTITMIVVAGLIVVLSAGTRIYKQGKARNARIAAGLQ